MGSSPKKIRGFTLIEVLIVVAIVGILAAIAVPAYMYTLDRAKRITALSALDAVRTEMEAYFTGKGSYPSSIDFTSFTDQNGGSVLIAINWDRIKNKVYSWDSYSQAGNTYALTVKANDSAHTSMILTPQGVTF